MKPPQRFMVASGTTVRLSSDLSSEELGKMKRGEVVTVTHTKEVNGITRLRCSKGWLTQINSSGFTLCIVRALALYAPRRSANQKDVAVCRARKTQINIIGLSLNARFARNGKRTRQLQLWRNCPRGRSLKQLPPWNWTPYQT